VLTGIGIACTLASGASSSIRAAFDFVLDGTSVFLGVLFLLTASAAVRIFARDRQLRLTGAVLPGLGALALVAIVGFSLVQSDTPTRTFVGLTAFLGLPLAVWRGRR
jgi:hypothetical protein